MPNKKSAHIDGYSAVISPFICTLLHFSKVSQLMCFYGLSFLLKVTDHAVNGTGKLVCMRGQYGSMIFSLYFYIY